MGTEDQTKITRKGRRWEGKNKEESCRGRKESEERKVGKK